MTHATRAPFPGVVYLILLAGTTGAAWLDGQYARALRGTPGEESLRGVFSAVSDAMLLPFGLTMLAGVIAGFCASGRARWLYVVSLGALTLELLLPALVGATSGAMDWIGGKELLLRLVVLLGALICATWGLRESPR